jgi:hypothetical protein
MSLYTDLRTQFGHASAETKLPILRVELLTEISSIQAAAALLKRADVQSSSMTAHDLSHVLDVLDQASNNLRDILDALTDPRERDVPAASE